MWCEIVFENTGSADGIAMFHQLQADGLKPGVDFDWKYIPGEWKDEWQSEQGHGQKFQEKSVVLMFREQAMATFYTLKWQH